MIVAPTATRRLSMPTNAFTNNNIKGASASQGHCDTKTMTQPMHHVRQHTRGGQQPHLTTLRLQHPSGYARDTKNSNQMQQKIMNGWTLHRCCPLSFRWHCRDTLASQGTCALPSGIEASRRCWPVKFCPRLPLARLLERGSTFCPCAPPVSHAAIPDRRESCHQSSSDVRQQGGYHVGASCQMFTIESLERLTWPVFD